MQRKTPKVKLWAFEIVTWLECGLTCIAIVFHRCMVVHLPNYTSFYCILNVRTCCAPFVIPLWDCPWHGTARWKHHDFIIPFVLFLTCTTRSGIHMPFLLTGKPLAYHRYRFLGMFGGFFENRWPSVMLYPDCSDLNSFWVKSCKLNKTHKGLSHFFPTWLTKSGTVSSDPRNCLGGVPYTNLDPTARWVWFQASGGDCRYWPSSCWMVHCFKA